MLDLALQLDPELRLAVELAEKAGAAILRVRAEGAAGAEVRRKADASPVTRADLDADALIRAGLREAFPDDAVISEEHAATGGTSGRVWVIDPLDGTKAFVAGTEDFAVQVGLVIDGEPVLGVVYEPETRRLFHAIKGVGAFLGMGRGTTIRQLRVSKRTEYADMTFLTSSSMGDGAQQAILDALGMADGGRIRSVGCKVGKLVRRDADVYYSAHPVHVWDSCAPLVVLEAAGGRATRLDGSALSYADLSNTQVHAGPLLATNGHRLDDLCRDLSAALQALSGV
jgi:3'(2'), 5'-bisphosphate nucleotidase